jgi:hypothetical protein
MIRVGQKTGIIYTKEDMTKCKICGKWFVLLGSHTHKKHGVTGREYRIRFGLEVKKNLIKGKLLKLRQQQNVKYNTAVRIAEAGRKYRFVKGDKRAGRYKRCAKTIKRLREMVKKRWIGHEKVEVKCALCGVKFKIFLSRYKKRKEWRRFCCNDHKWKFWNIKGQKRQ